MRALVISEIGSMQIHRCKVSRCIAKSLFINCNSKFFIHMANRFMPFPDHLSSSSSSSHGPNTCTAMNTLGSLTNALAQLAVTACACWLLPLHARANAKNEMGVVMSNMAGNGGEPGPSLYMSALHLLRLVPNVSSVALALALVMNVLSAVGSWPKLISSSVSARNTKRSVLGFGLAMWRSSRFTSNAPTLQYYI